MKIAATALVLALLAGAGAWFHVARSSDPDIFDSTADLRPVEAGLVLGTSRLINGGAPNAFFSARIEAAARLYASGKVNYLVVSGNQARGGRAAGGYDEPTDMRDALIAAGVPAERIYRDYAGFRTLDSVLRARAVFGLDKATVVSQHFHLERALYLARGNGMEFQGFEAKGVPVSQMIRPGLREFGARILAVVDVLRGRDPRHGGARVVVGLDPPS
jgi:SanA protein